MDSEVNEKEEVTKQIRIELSEDIHGRVVKYQARLIGRKGEKVTLAEACTDIIDKATRSLKWKP